MPRDYIKWKKDFGLCVPYTAKNGLEGEIKLFCEFVYKTPKKTPKNAYKADLDNLIKSVGDALQDCGVIKNDRDIVELHAVKRWGLQDGIRVIVSLVAQTPCDKEI